jgi:UDP-3-O-[3-hydroxymyristoyl] glucosamine N-acyltransferase LpxD
MREFNLLRAHLEEPEIRRAIGLPVGGERVVEGVAPLGAAENRCLYFVNREVTGAVRESLARRRGCIVIAPFGSASAGDWGDCLVLEAADPRASIARVLELIRAERRQQPLVAERRIAPGAAISPLAVVEGCVEIGEGAVVEPFCVVGPDVRVGRGAILRSGVRVFPRVSIGDESVVGVNTVVGHDGYGFVRDEMGNKVRMPHLGGVLIGSHVEVGALVTVQGGTITPTVIEDYAKVDEHVHVGHNVRIARGASVTAAVVIAGHAVIEAEAWVGVNSSIREGRRVGSHALVGMDVSLQQDLPDSTVARAPRPDVRPRVDDDHTAIGFKERQGGSVPHEAPPDHGTKGR